MVIQQFLTQVNYTKGILKKNKCIIIHYTANDGDTAWGNCNYFYKEKRGASAQYFVDEKSIWQCVKDSDIAWSIGLDPEKLKTGKAKYYNFARNNNSINIEMCSKKDKNGNYYIPEETVKNTIELTKYLMKKYRYWSQRRF